jgi:UDP-glucuronate 4-epimerase
MAQALLADGWRVVGIDNLNPYYDPALKTAREAQLIPSPKYRAVHGGIETPGLLADTFAAEKPDLVVHLAAQAGVRASIDNPRPYLDSNIIGMFHLLEAARAHPPRHMLLASTSSAYGANDQMPYVETDRADHPLSFYAATKKAGEAMAHAYAHLYHLPITMFRFFTVYGPWGRPDMVPFLFTKAILSGQPINVYNHGDMRRDFTYIHDLVRAICLLIDAAPPGPDARADLPQIPGDSLSPAAPWRLVNIGNSQAVPLAEFIAAIEAAVGRAAQQNLMPMQAGDVPATWADARLLQALTGYRPQTDITQGIRAFVDWYRAYYGG